MSQSVDKLVVGRFAPSPTGIMHAGNIFSALICWLIVRLQGGRIVLRIEDLDGTRSRVEFADRIQRDFEALGLTWDEGPYYQNTEGGRYRALIDRLERHGLVYPCFCTRADLQAASAPHAGEMQVYAGTCRNLTAEQRAERLAERRAGFARKEDADAYRPALRVRCDDRVISFDDFFQGMFSCRLDEECGDFVVARSDGGASYQLAVVADDAAQGVNCIVRGCDLLPVTPQQIYLQRLLGYETPAYAHIPLLVDGGGVRLAKRHKSAHYDELLARYGSPQKVLGHICALAGLSETTEPLTPEELLARYTLESLQELYRGVTSIIYAA